MIRDGFVGNWTQEEVARTLHPPLILSNSDGVFRARSAKGLAMPMVGGGGDKRRDLHELGRGEFDVKVARRKDIFSGVWQGVIVAATTRQLRAETKGPKIAATNGIHIISPDGWHYDLLKSRYLTKNPRSTNLRRNKTELIRFNERHHG